MAKSILEELVTVLGFEIDDDDLKKFNKQVDAAEKGMKTFTLVATAAAAAVGVYLDSMVNATFATSEFSNRVGASFEEVQRLTHATKLWGGSIEDVKSTLTSLSRLASTAARGAGGGAIFGFIGVSPTQNGQIKDSIQLLKEIADATNKFPSAARRADLLSQFGINERMIILLRKGSEGIEKLGAELDQFGFVLTEEQAENAQKYFQAVVRAKAAVKGLGNEMGLRLTPRLTESINEFLKWVETNKKFIPANIDQIITNLEKLKGPLEIAIGLFLALKVAMNLKKVGIVAILAALVLVLDDLNKFRKGEGKTVTGKAFDQLTDIGGREDVRGFVRTVESARKAALDFAARGLLTATQAGSPSSRGVNGANNVTNNIEFRIDGSRDPQSTGIAVVDRLREFFRGEFSGVTVAPRT